MLMAKTKKRSAKKVASETDSAYFLKIVLFLIIGTQWLRIEQLPNWSIPIPVGLIIGLIYASHDHFSIDRKIEYALLIISAFIAFWLPMGITIQV